MRVLLDHELVLAPVQRTVVEQCLMDREEDIRTCHEAILRAGVVDIWHYEWQVGLMKEAWYRKIDALLDRAQHDRFVALVQIRIATYGATYAFQVSCERCGERIEWCPASAGT
jgi:hypothetical protein